MGMADPRTYEQKMTDFNRDKMFLIGVVSELLAVEILEYNNNTWLCGDNESRSAMRMEILRDLRNGINNLKW
jgi:hypothetical protein